MKKSAEGDEAPVEVRNGLQRATVIRTAGSFMVRRPHSMAANGSRASGHYNLVKCVR